MALCRFFPLSAVQFYVQGVAGLVALLPLAHRMWQHRPIPLTTQQGAPQTT
jgi:hypothetical protein